MAQAAANLVSLERDLVAQKSDGVRHLDQSQNLSCGCNCAIGLVDADSKRRAQMLLIT